MKNLLSKLLVAVLAGGFALLAQAAAPTMFVDSLELKVGSITAADTLENTPRAENLPVLVKVYEDDEKFPGFMLKRSGGLEGDGSDIRFSQNNEIIPHERLADEVNAEGKKVFVFWVKVPLVTAGSTIKLHWGVKDGKRAPINHSREVWSEFYGVWHDVPYTETNPINVADNNLVATRDQNGNLIVPGFAMNGGFTISGTYKGEGIDTATYPGGESNIERNLLFGNFLRNRYGWGADIYFVNQYCGRVTSNGKNGYAAKANMNPNTVAAWHDVAFVGNDDFTYAFYVDNNAIGHSGDSQNYSHPTAPSTVPIRLARDGYSAREIRFAKVAHDSTWLTEAKKAYENAEYVTLGEGGHVISTYKNSAGEDVLENYWIREPSIAGAWSDPEKAELDVGRAMFGGPGSLSYSIQDASGSTPYGTDFANLLTENGGPGPGAYRVVITTADQDDEGNPIKQLQKTLYFAYVTEVKSQLLGDNQTMLFNDVKDKISGQGYYDSEELGGWKKTTIVEKDIVDEVEVTTTIKSDAHYEHPLGWKIRNGAIGSALSKENASATLDSTVNYLPFGPDAYSYWNPAQEAANLSDAGAAILYNCSDHTDPAAVYSPIYEKGVGEIYFDAVNMNVDYRNRLELQYLSLEDLRNKKSNMTLTLADVQLDDWASYAKKATLDILPIKEGEKAPLWTDRTFVPLMMTKVGSEANTKSLYRVRAKLNLSDPVIFRIARTDTSWGAGGLTGPGKILVDNILVSDPTTDIELERIGETWDPNRDFGKWLHGDRGTLTKRFPKVGDEDVRAQVRVKYKGFGSADTDSRSRNVAALIFEYRNRYLNTNLGSEGEWKSARMEVSGDDDTVFVTSEPLDLGNLPGDVEYRFTYTLNPTRYDYVDYFGLTGCTFETAASEVTEPKTFAGSEPTPALGTDFFFRLRDGDSDYEQMELQWHFNDSADVVTNQLHLIEDHLWTGAITVTNANARLGFKMIGVNNKNGTWNGWRFPDANVAVDDATKSETWSPYSTIAEKLEDVENVEDIEKIDFKNIAASVTVETRQFVVRFNDDTGAFSLCRGDYQDFNHWTDAAAQAEGKFVIHAGQAGDDGKTIPISNSVLQRRYPENLADNVVSAWPKNVDSDVLWQEHFNARYSDEEAARTDVLLGAQGGEATLNDGWVGYNFMYVNESLNNLFSEGYESRAALLKGRGYGMLVSKTRSSPDGIGEIKFNARLGQQHSYDRISTYRPNGDDFTQKDYLVSTRVVMSDHATGATDLGFDGQGTVSIFAYHDASGSYEFRMKRLTRNQIELGLYRWYQEQGTSTLKVKELYRAVRNSNGLESDRNAGRTPGTVLCSQKITDVDGNPVQNTTAYVAFLSVKSIYEDKTVDGVTKKVYVGNQLYAGFTNNNGNGSAYSNCPSVDTEVAGHEMTYHSFYCQDRGFKDSKNRDVKPLRSGTFGFLSTDCPARFMRPQVHDALDRIATQNLAYSDKIILPAVRVDDGNTYCIGTTAANDTTKADFWDHWNIAPSAGVGEWALSVNNKKYFGIVTPEVAQKVVISTCPENGSDSDWQELDSVEVNSFNYSPISIKAHTTDKTRVRIATYDDPDEEQPRYDVILDDLEMTQWHASTMSGASESSTMDKFVFTGVWNALDEVTGVSTAQLWPLRVKTTEYQTIRAPYLASGIGAITFTYDVETLDENAKIAIEYVSGNSTYLSAENAYYQVGLLTTEKDYQNAWSVWHEGTQDDKDYSFDYNDLVEKGGRITVYLGKRGGPSLVRLRVPQSTITAAHAQKVGSYGRIDIKSIVVWDEPNADECSWTAWNVRVANANTAADEYMTYDKLLHIDSWLDVGGSAGQSMELNNGAVDDLLEYNPGVYGAHLPYIQSPALKKPNGDGSAVTIGEISFRARKSGANAEADAIVDVYAVTDPNETTLKDENLIASTNLTSTTWQNFTFKNKLSGVVAVRLVMRDNDDDHTDRSSYDRALFDELAVTERVDPNVVVTFARPFRNYLNSTDPVADIDSPDEQPLCNEEWGIQCDLALKQLENVILPDTIRVYCDYYVEDFQMASAKWGYSEWKNEPASEGKRGRIELFRAEDPTEPSRLVYRMMRASDNRVDYIPPVTNENSVVQYNISITFETTQEAGTKDAQAFNPADSKQWTTPEWYYPVDYNRSYNGAAAYTIIDKVAPKRAWINEVNLWDGANKEGQYDVDTLGNSWIEIAIPSGVDMSDWSLQAVSANNDSGDGIKTYTLLSFGSKDVPSVKDEGSKNGPFAFYVAAHEDSELWDDEDTKPDAVLSIPESNNLGYTEGIFMSGGYFSDLTPFALRLVRPTGIVDHEILVGVADSSTLSGAYSNFAPDDEDTGHNKLVIAGTDDVATRDSEGRSVTISMQNVSAVADLTLSDRWNNALSATPGAINIPGQVADDYRIYPNDDTLRISFSVEGAGIEQDIGNGAGFSTDRQQTTTKKDKGETVTVNYRLAAWYEIKSLLVNGVEKKGDLVPVDGEVRVYSFTFEPTEKTDIVAIADNDSNLMKLIGNNNKYESAILDWMREKYADVDPATLASNLLELWSPNATGTRLSLTDMYWVCADMMDDADSPTSIFNGEWAFVCYPGSPNPATIVEGEGTADEYTTDVVKVPLYVYLTNTVTNVKKPVTSLASSKAYDKNSANWTREDGSWSTYGPTLQVKAYLLGFTSWGEDLSKKFIPVKYYLINKSSFDSDGYREAVLPDPFGPYSITGYYYNWTDYKNKGYNLLFNLEIDERPADKAPGYSIEPLR